MSGFLEKLKHERDELQISLEAINSAIQKIESDPVLEVKLDALPLGDRPEIVVLGIAAAVNEGMVEIFVGKTRTQ